MGLAERIGELGRGGAPLYQQLHDALRGAIEARVLKPEEPLPPEREIAAEFDVSRITVRKALDGLAEDGLVTRRQGAGTFVAGRVEKQFSKLSSFSEDMASRGRAPSIRWLDRREASVSPDESLTFGLGPGARVLRFHRIRFADGEPMALERSTIPGWGLPDPESVDASLYQALDAAGHRPARALQRLRAVLFNAEQAQLLGVEAGAPGLFIERRGFLADGRVIEMTHSWYRGDAYDFVAELNASA
ncbi:GntR family transcriptional regulator [Sphingomonas sp.]|uniref:GntR family transcriptional regulator n=1 Tax=Sphingomonas sp. TaxID=28214 RepID=UPI0035BBA149